MSKVTIAGDVNGTGVFTIAAPNGNTNRTLVLPDEAGTMALQGGAGVGKVLQVVQGTTASTTSTTGTTPVVTSLTASITPLFSSSKILVISTFALYAPGTTKSIAFLYRNGTNISAAAGGAYLYSSITSGAQITTGISLLDSPATTSATAYAIYLAGNNSGSSVLFNADNQNQQIILMEIAA